MSPPTRRSGPATNGAAAARTATTRNRPGQRSADLLGILDASTGRGVAASSAHQVLQHLALEAGEVLRRRGVEDAHGRAEVVSSWLAGLAVDVADRALVPAEPGGGGAA